MNWFDKMVLQFNRIFGFEETETTEAEFLAKLESTQSVVEINNELLNSSKTILELTENVKALTEKTNALNESSQVILDSAKEMKQKFDEQAALLVKANSQIVELAKEINTLKNVSKESTAGEGSHFQTESKTKEAAKVNWGANRKTSKSYFD